MPLLTGPDGTEIYYEVHGAGPPVLFIHGLGSSSRDWELQTPAFARRYRVILVDLRGHGRSQKPPGPYSMRMFAHDIGNLLDHLDIGRAAVIGLSLGGMVGFQLTLDFADRVSRLVVVGSAPEAVPRGIAQSAVMSLRLGLVRALPVAAINRWVAWSMFPESRQGELRRILVERWSRNDKRAYIAALRAAIGWSVMERIPEIACPTLIVAGEHDRMPLDVRGTYARRIRNARRVVIDNARHAPPVDRAEVFNLLVLDFLERDSESP